MRLEFEDPYELIEYLTRMIGHAVAHEKTSERLTDAHAYVAEYCMPEGLGRNVWHTILDDAIRMRQKK